jgi:cytoskeletal protein RodZ
MKTNWVVAVVLVGALAVAGLFVHGMTRVSGIASSPVSGTPAVRSAQAAPVPPRSAATAPAEPVAHAPAPASPTGATADTAPASAPDAVRAVDPARTADTAPPSPASAAPQAEALREPAPKRAPVARTEPAPATPARAMTAAQTRTAQCRTLADWLRQLDAIALERRADAGYQEWTRAQRVQARERQAELRCAGATS